MNKLNKVLIFSEDIAIYPELCSGGNMLGNHIQAIVVGERQHAEHVAQFSAETFWLGEKASDKMIEDYFPSIVEIINREKPNLVLMKATKSSRLLAGKMGVVLNAGVVTDAISFQIESDTNLTIQRLVYGGTAIRTEKPLTEITISLVGAGVFEVDSFDHAGEIIPVDSVNFDNRVICKSIHPKEGERVNLSVAKRVVGIGRGLAQQEDLQMVEEFAQSIGGELACSRPIAEGEKWMDVGRYIGVSGAMIKPDLYFALGISGQVQHMVGVNGAKTIIAINKDKNAPIFNYADYGIVGDIYKVIPALTQYSEDR